MDAVSYSLASKQAQRIEKFIENPDSTSGIVTVPKTIASGETITIPAGRVAVLPNVQVDGIVNILGEVFVPSGSTYGDLDAQIALKADIEDINTGNVVLKTIATGTATFNSTTNNINLTGIGIGVEIGDVIKISGADDTKNNSEFTIEVITDANNIIVNQAHANKGTTKNVANRSGDTGVTIKLLAKWYNAPAGLGQDWISVKETRVSDIWYPSPYKRGITSLTDGSSASVSVNNINFGGSEMGGYDCTVIYTTNIKITGAITSWLELR